jgi:polysaccharide biosynthesis protein PelD
MNTSSVAEPIAPPVGHEPQPQREGPPAPDGALALRQGKTNGKSAVRIAAESEEGEHAGRFSLFRLDRKPGWGFHWTSLAETVLFLAAVLAFNFLVTPQDPGYLSVEPHPFWAIILLISIRYFFKESIISALVVAGVYLYFIVFPAHGTFRFSTITLFTDFRDPLLFLIVAGFISGYTQHLLERTYVLRSRLRAKEQEIAELNVKHRAANQALRRLEGRIASDFTSILDLFTELARTKQMKPEQIKRNLLEVLTRYLNVRQVSYYDLDHNQPRWLFANIDGREVQQRAVPQPQSQDFLLGQALNTREAVHLGAFTQQQDLEQYQGLSLLAGALRGAADNPIGLVSVESIPFIDYNPHTFKLFNTILQWWGNVLDETQRLAEQRLQMNYDEALGLYSYRYFSTRIAQEFERARRFSLPMSLALLRIDHFAQVRPEKLEELRLVLARIINAVISELEMAARYRSEDLLAISFPIAMADDAEKRMREIVAQIHTFDFHPYQDPAIPLVLSWAIAGYEIGMASHQELIARIEQQLGVTDDA